MKFTKILPLIILNLFILWLFPIAVIACQCYNALPCEAYSRAYNVFIGKLQKLEEDNKSQVGEVYAYFAVERMFKGEFNKEIIVKFETGCRSPFKVGETYFVYDVSGQSNNLCNRTRLFSKKFSEKNDDLNYAESVSIEKPKFSIYGLLGHLSESELKQTLIEIEDGEKTYKISPTKNGEFEFLTYHQRIFKVKVRVPFMAEVFPGDIGTFPQLTTSKTNTQTLVEYNLNFQSNGCNFTELLFSKISSILPTNSIMKKEQ